LRDRPPKGRPRVSPPARKRVGIIPRVIDGSGAAGHTGPAADAARRKILDSAETLFAQNGFDATPTAQIADAAGVAKGLLFYYFPKKIDLLRTLLTERLPPAPLCDLHRVVRPGDPAGSLLRLARTLDLGGHESLVLRTIIFREASTHPEVRDHVRALREGLLQLTERVLDAATVHPLPRVLRRQAAHTYVAVMLDEANARRFDGPVPDLAGAAKIVANALLKA
jgi:AcrR family transcriptional regulator